MEELAQTALVKRIRPKSRGVRSLTYFIFRFVRRPHRVSYMQIRSITRVIIAGPRSNASRLIDSLG
jgi:hypothetical protein